MPSPLPIWPGNWGPLNDYLADLSTFHVVSNGTVVTAYTAGGGTVVSSTDAGQVLSEILPAANSAGAQIEFRNDGNVFPWKSVPALPKGITNKLLIRGNGVTVQLSAGGARFLDFNRVADYDTFQNIEIADLMIDCNNVGGKHHVVLGTYINGSQTVGRRCNFANITIRGVRTINVPVDSTTTNHRLNVWIASEQPAINEVTQTTLTNIVVEDCRFEGGNQGVFVGGVMTGAGTKVGTNISYDGIVFRNCWHSLLAAVGAGFSSLNYQVGSAAQGGFCAVTNCYGAFSGDVGIEIDNHTLALLDQNRMDDGGNIAYFTTNFNNPLSPNEQRLVLSRSHARHVNQGIGIFGKVSINNGVAHGRVEVLDCSYYRNSSYFATVTNGAEVFSVGPSVVLDSLTIRNFRAYVEGINWTTGSVTPFLINTNGVTGPSASTCAVTIENVSLTLAGAQSGGTISLRMLNLSGTLALKVDGVLGNFAFTGAAVSQNHAIVDLGGTVTSNLRGIISGVRFSPNWAGDTAPRGIIVRGTGTMTVGALPFRIERGDSASMPVGGSEILYIATSNAGNIRVRSNAWRTTPAPAALTGLVTATGAKVATGWDAHAVFAPGSGAGITAIDYSTNGGTTYTNFLTQASAALPAGFSQVLGPLPSDALIKVTFTTTQPTITLVPVNP